MRKIVSLTAFAGALLAAGAVSAQPARVVPHAHVAHASHGARAPAPTRTFVPAHWEQRGRTRVWVQAHWVAAPQHYAPPQRARSHGERYARNDQDRDGVPNRFDRDRDGDGVANWRDRAPANPWRR